ncbi:MAG: hypothetical protein ACRDZ7_15720 [Acidimicrobiia bacterium]
MIYVMINLALAQVATVLERRQRRARRRPVEAEVPVDIAVGQI